jgi:hypothetical protein
MCTPWSRMGRMEVEIHSFLTRSLDWSEWSASHLGLLSSAQTSAVVSFGQEVVWALKQVSTLCRRQTPSFRHEDVIMTDWFWTVSWLKVGQLSACHRGGSGSSTGQSLWGWDIRQLFRKICHIRILWSYSKKMWGSRERGGRGRFDGIRGGSKSIVCWSVKCRRETKK